MAAPSSSHPRLTTPSLRTLALLAALTVASIVVHGYHPYVEDSEIYTPGIKQQLNPALYPQNNVFFASHAHLTLFPNLIAWSIRLTHLPLDWALLLWQFLCTFLLLLGCWKIGRLVFRDSLAPWGGASLVAALLTIPVAGTALYIADQYLTTRSISTATVLFIVLNAVQRRWIRASLWALFTALIHPLMVGFGVAYVVVLLWIDWRSTQPDRSPGYAALLPLGLFPPVTDAYRDVLNSRSYFFLLRWEWYEWVGIFAPLLLLAWFAALAKRQGLDLLRRMCQALIVFGLLFTAAGAAMTIPVRFANLAELQPMRAFHLLYVLLFVFAGGLLAQFVLQRYVWRWLALFLPLCAGMSYAQLQLYPASPHLELPCFAPRNPWVETFLWVRHNTPLDAYFALDPHYLQAPGEDQHGFRALAERSRLADAVKDSGAVTMFPKLAETWRDQVRAQAHWADFTADDFRALHSRFGVTWVVLEKPVPGLTCPYENSGLRVCEIP